MAGYVNPVSQSLLDAVAAKNAAANSGFTGSGIAPTTGAVSGYQPMTLAESQAAGIGFHPTDRAGLPPALGRNQYGGSQMTDSVAHLGAIQTGSPLGNAAGYAGYIPAHPNSVVTVNGGYGPYGVREYGNGALGAYSSTPVRDDPNLTWGQNVTNSAMMQQRALAAALASPTNIQKMFTFTQGLGKLFGNWTGPTASFDGGLAAFKAGGGATPAIDARLASLGRL